MAGLPIEYAERYERDPAFRELTTTLAREFAAGWGPAEVLQAAALASRMLEDPAQLALAYEPPSLSRDVHELLAGLDVGSLGELRRLVENGRPDERLGILGRERALVKRLTRLFHDVAQRHHAYGPIRETRRGATFELHLNDGNEATGRVATVTVEIDRVEPFPEDARRDGKG